MPELENLAKNIKRIRKECKQSQIEFAFNCGISTETLSLIERERSDPKLSTIQKVAAYANCSVLDLLKN